MRILEKSRSIPDILLNRLHRQSSNENRNLLSEITVFKLTPNNDQMASFSSNQTFHFYYYCSPLVKIELQYTDITFHLNYLKWPELRRMGWRSNAQHFP